MFSWDGWLDQYCVFALLSRNQISSALKIPEPGPKCLDDYRRQLVNGSGSLAESPASSGFLGFSFDHFRWKIQKADESLVY
jgi:hypothetical protein